LSATGADYFVAKFAIHKANLAHQKVSQDVVRSLRGLVKDPRYGERARVVLAQLLIAQPELALSPMEALRVLEPAANGGNSKAQYMLAMLRLKLPNANKTAAVKLLMAASRKNAAAAQSLEDLVETRAIALKSPYLLNDIRHRRFLRDLDGAETGAATSMVRVGDAYRLGDGVPQDIKSAETWYDKAVAIGNNQGRLRQIDLLHDRGDQASNEKAHRLALAASTIGNSIGALVELGRDFRFGRGTASDPVKAEAYLRKAAASNSPVGQYELADLLMHKQPQTTEGNQEILDLLNRSASAGNGAALYAQYLMAKDGTFGVTANPVLAVQYLMSAAKAGRTVAQTELAIRYYRGDAQIQRNEPEGFRWAATALGDGARSPTLSVIMGDAYANGDLVQQDRNRAKAFYEKAVGLGSAAAMRKLAGLYFTLPGQDAPRQAVIMLRRAANKGEAIAYVDLGRAYATGAGGSVDAQLAFSYFQMAANSGSVDGLVEMGRAYATGYGVTRDSERAVATFQKAAGLGNVEAMLLLSYCYEKGDGAPQSVETAREWLSKAAAIGNPEGEYWYGIYLMEGRGGPQNRTEGLQWLNKARDGHFRPAMAYFNNPPAQVAAVPKAAAAASVKRDFTPAPEPEDSAPDDTDNGQDLL
ncbi:MAG: sel1 repeat family protein, partial [Asticcacaulis sp.]|nr:sel1 repeat family protein [Asticcacaulis sp.]